MEHIIKSLTPVALFVVGAVVFVLGTAFLIASDATLSPSSLGASSDLAQAGRWLQFLAGACVLGAVCTAGWELVLRSEWAASAVSPRLPAAGDLVSWRACSRRPG